MAWPRARRRQRRERAPSRRDEVVSRRRRRRRNRCDRDWTASDESLRLEWGRRTRAPPPPAPARVAATGRVAWQATTAPASRQTRSALPAASYIDSSTLLQTEFGGVNLPATLEVHSDSATTIGCEDSVHCLGVR